MLMLVWSGFDRSEVGAILARLWAWARRNRPRFGGSDRVLGGGIGSRVDRPKRCSPRRGGRNRAAGLGSSA